MFFNSQFIVLCIDFESVFYFSTVSSEANQYNSLSDFGLCEQHIMDLCHDIFMSFVLGPRSFFSSGEALIIGL